ncbi:MAG: response regulator [Bdellovibrionales bacterium]|nr:response regulator [Bdellovibrionales bacterium]
MAKKKLNAKNLVEKIEKITKERIAQEKVVSLKEYREVKGQLEPQTLLIIEDDETMRRGMRRIFESDGHKVIAAADGTQLNAVLDDSPIDLIILDVGLPWINGFELAKLMKEHEDLSDIPLIFVSARTNEDDLKKGFDVGADDYIKKPFDIEQIRSAVNTLLKLHNN